MMGRPKQRTTTWINGQRGTWVDPQADPSGEPQQALRKACAAWVVNNGCVHEFIKSVRESGYFMVLVRLDAPRKTRKMRRAPAEREKHAFAAG
jgi:hypothetical protein